MVDIDIKFEQWRRSHEKSYARFFKNEMEFMDDPDMSIDAQIPLMKELGECNKRIGANKIVIKEVVRIAKGMQSLVGAGGGTKTLKILDLGMGDGSLLEDVLDWSKKSDIMVDLAGIERSPAYTDYLIAKYKKKNLAIRIICDDARSLDKINEDSFDIAVSTFTAHHIQSVNDITSFFSQLSRVAKCGWIVMDFERSRLALALFQMSRAVLSRSDILEEDGRRSVRRSFTQREMAWLLLEWGKTAGRVGQAKCRSLWPQPYWIASSDKHSS